MMRFIYQYQDVGPKVEMTLPDDTTLPEALEQFENFLKAVGYSFAGVIDVIDEIEEN